MPIATILKALDLYHLCRNQTAVSDSVCMFTGEEQLREYGETSALKAGEVNVLRIT